MDDDACGGDSPIPGLVADLDRVAGVQRARVESPFRRAVLLVISTVMVLGIAGLVGFGGYRYALTSPRFALRRIQVEGARRSTDAELLARVGLRLGDNVISMDVGAVERKILEDPWILEAKVQRRLPATVSIAIVENEAGALALVAGHMVVLSRSGVPFKEFEPSDGVELPIITGACIDESDCDPRHQGPRLSAAMEVVRYYERTALSRVHPIQEVHVESGGEMTLTIGRRGTALHLGMGPWARKLAMAERVLGRMGREASKLPSSVFLDNRTHPERVVVRVR